MFFDPLNQTVYAHIIMHMKAEITCPEEDAQCYPKQRNTHLQTEAITAEIIMRKGKEKSSSRKEGLVENRHQRGQISPQGGRFLPHEIVNPTKQYGGVCAVRGRGSTNGPDRAGMDGPML